RPRFIRVIVGELERLHSHLLWTGIAAEDIGFQTMFMESFALRERVMDVLESVRLIEAALRKLPEGPTRAGAVFPIIPTGEATARSEAPRGELFYYLASDGSDTPTRVKVRTPSFVNIPSIEAMCGRQNLAVLPLIQASVDPCCSCTDR
ncbi:MAG TPA: hypothetical protein VN648_27025, partial [Candidatus Methylomirabilis sp.]|nr:hypothetical protein [Candidatus Methylomirabilis sp.]